MISTVTIEIDDGQHRTRAGACIQQHVVGSCLRQVERRGSTARRSSSNSRSEVRSGGYGSRVTQELRPPDQRYYEDRTAWVGQEDIFRDVPLGYPFPADAVDRQVGRRKFSAGPFEPSFGPLLTPNRSLPQDTACLRAQKMGSCRISIMSLAYRTAGEILS